MCENPRTIWLRRYYPVDGNQSEERLKQLNTPKMNYRKGYYSIQVPCGCCLECKLQHSADWATRCWCEFQNWNNGLFVTLTYNNDHLPINEKTRIPELRKEHMVQFMKNLRKNIKGEKYWENPITHKWEAPIRFMGCGEYGEKKGRPHYHLCLFNIKLNDLKYYKTTNRGDILYTSKTLQKCWEDKQGDKKSRGIIIIGELNYKSACYVARYCQKKAGIEPKKRTYKLVEEYDPKIGEIKFKRKIIKPVLRKTEEFINCSRCPGIGREYWELNKEKIKENSGIWINDGTAKLKNIPRYYKKLWKEENWLEYERWSYETNKKAEEAVKEQIKKFIWRSDFTDEQKIKYLKEKKAILLRERIKYLKRDYGDGEDDIICDLPQVKKKIVEKFDENEDRWWEVKNSWEMKELHTTTTPLGGLR